MKRLFTGLLLIVALSLLTAMGGLGGTPEGTVPQTDENIKVKLTDRDNVTTDLSQFSLDGKTALEGQRGSGKILVYLRNVATAEFGSASGDDIPVDIKLKSGETLQIKMRKRLVFYGSTGYGAFQIKASSVRRIDVL